MTSSGSCEKIMRHLALRDLLSRTSRWADLAPKLALSKVSTADILRPNCSFGKTFAIDFRISSPLQNSLICICSEASGSVGAKAGIRDGVSTNDGREIQRYFFIFTGFC